MRPIVKASYIILLSRCSASQIQTFCRDWCGSLFISPVLPFQRYSLFYSLSCTSVSLIPPQTALSTSTGGDWWSRSETDTNVPSVVETYIWVSQWCFEAGITASLLLPFPPRLNGSRLCHAFSSNNSNSYPCCLLQHNWWRLWHQGCFPKEKKRSQNSAEKYYSRKITQQLKIQISSGHYSGVLQWTVYRLDLCLHITSKDQRPTQLSTEWWTDVHSPIRN